MSADEQNMDDERKSLLHRLELLKHARDALKRELDGFTEKATKEVEIFLNSPYANNTKQGVNLLKTIDARCLVISKLMQMFEDLKSGCEYESLGIHLRNKVNLFPQHEQINYLKRCSARVYVPQVIKFGPLLQNVILARSIQKTAQIVDATLSPKQAVLSFASVKEKPHNKDESTDTEKRNVGTNMQQNITAKETEAQKEVLEEICPNIPQKVVTHIPVYQFENDTEVQHQKQTSPQLMYFLSKNGKIKQVPLFGFAGAVGIGFSETEKLQNSSEASKEKKSAEEHIIQKRPLISMLKLSEPTFMIKNSGAEAITYSCVVATDSELWDVAVISTEMKHSSSAVVSNKRLASDKYNDYQVLTPFSQSFNLSSKESVTSGEMEQQSDPKKLTDELMDRGEDLVMIPEFQIKKFDELPVVVTHVVSPSNFYIQHRDTNLQELSEIMARKNSQSYAERNCVPHTGAHVMGWFPKEQLWCRAQVSKICGMNRGSGNLCTWHDCIRNTEVEVVRIDFGDSTCLSLWNVKELCEEAVKIPAQALQVSLVNVNPLDGESWTDEAVGWFKDKVSSQTLYARLYPERNEKRVMVELFTEKGKIGSMRRGASLSLRLAQNGHARHNQMKNRKVKRSDAREQSEKEMEWEKYLIFCYSQNRK